MSAEEIKKLQESTAGLFEELKTRNDTMIADAEKRGGEVSAEMKDSVDKINTAMEETRESIKNLEVRLNRPKFDMEKDVSPEVAERQNAFIKFLRVGAPGMGGSWKPEEVEALNRTRAEMDKRALAGTSDTDGGIFIPPSFESGIIMKAYDQAEIRPIANVGTTGRDRVIFGSLSKPSVAWGRAAIEISEQDLSSGGKISDVHPLQGLTAISIDTLEDSEADIVSEMMGGFSMAIAEAEDDAWAVGSGAGEPSGIASDTTVQANYAASGVADALSDGSNNGTDAMIAAQYKIKKTYRRNASWGMNSSTESAVRILKDGTGRYLWQPSLQIGTPPTFDGYRIVNPEGMASIAAGAIAMIFGDFNQYKIRDRSGMTVQRLVEKYATFAQIGFLVRRRTSGILVLPEAFSSVKIAVS